MTRFFTEKNLPLLCERRFNHNSLLWNVPSLVFVAQTFIWTLSLDSDISAFLRCIISFLSIVIALISFQMFERSRLMEMVDAEQMYSIEKYFEIQNYEKKNSAVMIIHHRLDKRTLIDGRYGQLPILYFVKDHPCYKKHSKKCSFCQLPSTRL